MWQVPNGELTSAQLRALGDQIKPLGEKGCADITTRANIQLRGMTLAEADKVFQVNAAGAQRIMQLPEDVHCALYPKGIYTLTPALNGRDTSYRCLFCLHHPFRRACPALDGNRSLQCCCVHIASEPYTLVRGLLTWLFAWCTGRAGHGIELCADRHGQCAQHDWQPHCWHRPPRVP